MNSINVYAALSTLLAMLPTDSAQIAERTGAKLLTVRKWLRLLRAGGVVTFGSKVGKHGSRLVHLIPSKAYKPATRGDRADTVWRLIAAWHALEARRTTSSLADEIDVCTRTAQTIVSHLKAAGVIRIAGWESHGKTVTPCYDRLDGADAPRPQRTPRSEVNALYWSKRVLSQHQAVSP